MNSNINIEVTSQQEASCRKTHVDEKIDSANKSNPSSSKPREIMSFHEMLLYDNKDAFEIKMPDGRIMVALP